MGPPRRKTNNSANADFQPAANTQEAPSNTVQNFTSRLWKPEKLFADEISIYTSITAGIHSQYFFLNHKIRHLEPGISDAIICKVPSVKFVLTLQKWPDHHLIFSLNWPHVLVVISSGTTPMDTTSSSTSTLMVLDPLLASVLQFYSPSPWRLRQSFPMTLLKAHPHWYSSSTGSTKHLDEVNPT